MKAVLGCFLIIVFTISGSLLSDACAFTDSTGLYQVHIPPKWVYQVKESDELLHVFYGQGDSDLLYFELLCNVGDQTALDFAQRSLKLYGEPGGLPHFELHQPPEPVLVGGAEGVLCVYSYKPERGSLLWEQRVFLILREELAFSITLGGTGSWENSVLLNDILSGWRWLP